ncbi:hypothetical protein DERF_013727 [Dermatophagoides farinae]|uniref:Uncharacterized protein n=1 Tax=Dermatophagoides farinae TaxID=6954 RepID=A0A922HN43_DERFA|nr:hypothetical protein DERF_013727 [Dermatophagoides farinae]
MIIITYGVDHQMAIPLTKTTTTECDKMVI